MVSVGEHLRGVAGSKLTLLFRLSCLPLLAPPPPFVGVGVGIGTRVWEGWGVAWEISLGLQVSLVLDAYFCGGKHN